MTTTSQVEYAERLALLESVWWKRLLRVQLPYELNLRRLKVGKTLDVGCGLGRNLRHLPAGSVGVDHNVEAVHQARSRGLDAYTVQEFRELDAARRTGFDTLLLAHVVEHMTEDEAAALLDSYLECLAPAGKAIIITPQQKGYRTDPTHVRYVDLDAAARLAKGAGLRVERAMSFPFPRIAGQIFPYNEFVLVARKTPSGSDAAA